MQIDSSFGQATFIFKNYAGAGFDVPVFDSEGNRLAGTNYVAMLYGGATPDSLAPAWDEAPFHQMTPAPFTYMPNNQSGYFSDRNYVQIGSVICGGTPWLQVRAWDARLGNTYEDVIALGIGGFGESNVFQRRGGDPCGLPTQPELLIGLQSFSLRPVPEPSTWALVGVGAGFLLWRWRRKRTESKV